jgi:hypothetical protein
VVLYPTSRAGKPTFPSTTQATPAPPSSSPKLGDVVRRARSDHGHGVALGHGIALGHGVALGERNAGAR